MKKLFALLVLCTTMATAQVHRFVYEYKYQPNSKLKDTIYQDLMALDIDAKGSVYKSLHKIQTDSIKAEIWKNFKPGVTTKIDLSGTGSKKGTVSTSVIKDYAKNEVFLLKDLDGQNYKIKDEEKQVWKISPEKKKIGNYTAQKATTSWGGRDWTAWFVEELPFPDGPYKFQGLPGLIVSIEDATGGFKMNMIANKKLQPKVEVKEKSQPNGLVFDGDKAIEISEEKYKKVVKNYIADPAKSIREMASPSSGNRVVVTSSVGGKPLDFKEMIKNKEERVRKSIEFFDNSIEPTLIK